MDHSITPVEELGLKNDGATKPPGVGDDAVDKKKLKFAHRAK
jgi:hypothetical protein